MSKNDHTDAGGAAAQSADHEAADQGGADMASARAATHGAALRRRARAVRRRVIAGLKGTTLPPATTAAQTTDVAAPPSEALSARTAAPKIMTFDAARARVAQAKTPAFILDVSTGRIMAANAGAAAFIGGPARRRSPQGRGFTLATGPMRASGADVAVLDTAMPVVSQLRRYVSQFGTSAHGNDTHRANAERRRLTFWSDGRAVTTMADVTALRPHPERLVLVEADARPASTRPAAHRAALGAALGAAPSAAPASGPGTTASVNAALSSRGSAENATSQAMADIRAQILRQRGAGDRHQARGSAPADHAVPHAPGDQGERPAPAVADVTGPIRPDGRNALTRNQVMDFIAPLARPVGVFVERALVISNDAWRHAFGAHLSEPEAPEALAALFDHARMADGRTVLGRIAAVGSGGGARTFGLRTLTLAGDGGGAQEAILVLAQIMRDRAPIDPRALRSEIVVSGTPQTGPAPETPASAALRPQTPAASPKAAPKAALAPMAPGDVTDAYPTDAAT